MSKYFGMHLKMACNLLVLIAIVFTTTSCKMLLIGEKKSNNQHNKNNEIPQRRYDAYYRSSLDSGWKVMPLRSQEEFLQNKIGGGAHQIMHGMVRCRDYQEIVYALQDVAGPWRSIDGGKSWDKPTASGLFAVYGQSIAVDPVKPGRVLISTYHPWDGKLEPGMDEHNGIYLSTDFGETWNLVLNKPEESFGFDWSIHRGYNENITYSSSSIDENGAALWYAAFHGNGLYESIDYGENWSKINDLSSPESIYEIEVDPSNADRIYIASSDGLYMSNDRGRSFTIKSITASTSAEVTSIEIDQDDSSRFWVIQRGEDVGLYVTTNNGFTFEKIIHTTRADEEDAYRIFQSPADPSRLYLIVAYRYYVSDDKGITWTRVMSPGSRAPGLGRIPDYARIGGKSAAVVPSAQDVNDVAFHSEATFFKASENGGIETNGSEPVEANDYFTGIAIWGGSFVPYGFQQENPETIAIFSCDVGMKISQNGGDWFSSTKPVGEVFDEYGINTTYQGQTGGTFDPADSNTLISTIGQYSKSWLVRSTDLGQSWKMYNASVNDYVDLAGGDTRYREYFLQDMSSGSIHIGISRNSFLAYHPDPSSRVVFADDKISRDGGETFLTIPRIHRNPDDNSSPLYTIRIIGFCYKNGSTTVYATANNRIYRSDDITENPDGSWRLYIDLVSQGINLAPIDSTLVFAADPHDRDLIYFLGNNGDLGWYNEHSDDPSSPELVLSAGVIALAKPQVPGNCVLKIAPDPTNAGVVYAATTFPGTSYVFRSTNYGRTWSDITGILPQNGMLSGTIMVNPHTGELYRGGPFGTWVYTP